MKYKTIKRAVFLLHEVLSCANNGHEKGVCCQCRDAIEEYFKLPAKPRRKAVKVRRPGTCEVCPIFGVCGCYAPHQSAIEQNECRKAWRRLSRYLFAQKEV